MYVYVYLLKNVFKVFNNLESIYAIIYPSIHSSIYLSIHLFNKYGRITIISETVQNGKYMA